MLITKCKQLKNDISPIVVRICLAVPKHLIGIFFIETELETDTLNIQNTHQRKIEENNEYMC